MLYQNGKIYDSPKCQSFENYDTKPCLSGDYWHKTSLISNKMYALIFIQMHEENVISLTFYKGLGRLYGFL